MSKYNQSLKTFAYWVLVFQLVVLFLYGFFVRTNQSPASLKQYYPWYQDVNTMMLIGFGFLMTFIRSNSWTALGFTFLINALAVQEYIIMHGLWNRVFEGMSHTPMQIHIDTPSLIFSSYAVAAVLISFGALIGRVTPAQLLLMTALQVFFYSLSEAVLYDVLKVVDAGGSMVIHTFGAYFGLAASLMVGRNNRVQNKTPSSSYSSNMFAVFGTFFLWMFWPSFNSAWLPSATQEDNVIRLTAIINTLVSLTGSCLSAFAFSKLMRGKFDMEDVLNATLAGGVIIGAPCTIIQNPVGALAIGLFAGMISTAGFAKMTSKLNSYMYDVCGIHNLHGIPGVLGGLISAMVFGFYVSVQTPSIKLNPESTHDYSKQAGMQVAGTFVSMGIAIASGLFVGLLMSFLKPLESEEMFEDQHMWEIPEAKQYRENSERGHTSHPIAKLESGVDLVA